MTLTAQEPARPATSALSPKTRRVSPQSSFQRQTRPTRLVVQSICLSTCLESVDLGNERLNATRRVADGLRFVHPIENMILEIASCYSSGRGPAGAENHALLSKS
jgi:hypothetical protein